MGDADISRRDIPALPIEQVTGVLDALDDDLTYLHDTLHILEQRTFRALSAQMRGYTVFRRFFLAMNFIMLPILLAAGLCYSLKEMPISEEFQPVLQSAIVILLYFAGGIGVPLYLGTLWAIFSFSVKQIITDDDSISSLFINDDIRSMPSDLSQSDASDDDIRSMPSDLSQPDASDNGEDASELEDDQFIVLSADQDIMPQMKSSVSSKIQDVEKSLPELPASNGTESSRVEDDTENSDFSFGVDAESDTLEIDYPKQKNFEDGVIEISQTK